MLSGSSATRRRHRRPLAAAVVAVSVSVVVVTASVALGVSLRAGTAGSSTASQGNLSGIVVATTGTTTVQPTDALIVELQSGHDVVARDRVPPGASFHFRAAPGRYTLGVEGSQSCGGAATLHRLRRTATLVVCTLFAALTTVAFADVPMAGAITTRADALKRAAAEAVSEGTTRLDAVETTLGSYITRSTTGKTSIVLPANETPTTPVWVTCAGGGTYRSFNGTSGYRSTCHADDAQTGSPLATIQSEGFWPTWFTRLPPLVATASPTPITTAYTSITTTAPGWSVTLAVKQTTTRAGRSIPATLTITNETGHSVRFDSCHNNGVFGMNLENRHVPQGGATGAVACSTTVHPGPNVFHRKIWTGYVSCSPSSPPCPAPLPAGVYYTVMNWPRFSVHVPKPGKLTIRLTHSAGHTIVGWMIRRGGWLQR